MQFAREQQALKRGGQAIQVSLSEAAAIVRQNPDLVALDDALTTLEKLDPRQARTTASLSSLPWVEPSANWAGPSRIYPDRLGPSAN